MRRYVKSYRINSKLLVKGILKLCWATKGIPRQPVWEACWLREALLIHQMFNVTGDMASNPHWPILVLYTMGSWRARARVLFCHSAFKAVSMLTMHIKESPSRRHSSGSNGQECEEDFFEKYLRKFQDPPSFAEWGAEQCWLRPLRHLGVGRGSLDHGDLCGSIRWLVGGCCNPSPFANQPGKAYHQKGWSLDDWVIDLTDIAHCLCTCWKHARDCHNTLPQAMYETGICAKTWETEGWPLILKHFYVGKPLENAGWFLKRRCYSYSDFWYRHYGDSSFCRSEASA